MRFSRIYDCSMMMIVRTTTVRVRDGERTSKYAPRGGAHARLADEDGDVVRLRVTVDERADRPARWVSERPT